MIGHGKEMRTQATAWAHKSTNLHNTMKAHAQRSWRVEEGKRRKVHLLFSRARKHARRLESSDGLLLLLLLLRVSTIARLLLRGRRPSEATTVVATLLRRRSSAAVACGRHLAWRGRSRREASRRMSVRRSRRRRARCVGHVLLLLREASRVGRPCSRARVRVAAWWDGAVGGTASGVGRWPRRSYVGTRWRRTRTVHANETTAVWRRDAASSAT